MNTDTELTLYDQWLAAMDRRDLAATHLSQARREYYAAAVRADDTKDAYDICQGRFDAAVKEEHHYRDAAMKAQSHGRFCDKGHDGSDPTACNHNLWEPR